VYPNPSAGPVSMDLQLAVPSEVHVEIFDILGRSVGRASWPNLASGRHQLRLSLPAGAAGWYGYRLTAGTSIIYGTMSVVD